jgi:hypothetical protein
MPAAASKLETTTAAEIVALPIRNRYAFSAQQSLAKMPA